MQLVPFKSYFPTCLGACKQSYNTQNVLTGLLEGKRKSLDNNLLLGDVCMDLEKAFDCTPYDLLIAKLAANGSNETALKYIYSYLKNHRKKLA